MGTMLQRLSGKPASPAPAFKLDLAEMKRWCEQSRPIFIVGLARSGTSMLQVAFAQHPSMFDIANCRETFVFLRPRQPYEDPVHAQTRGYLKGLPNMMALRQWIEPYEKEFGTMSEADSIRAFFYFAGNAVYPGRNPLEKTPGHLRKLELIFDIFPRSKIIVCSRDPVDVVASYRKRLAKSRAEGEPAEKSAWLEKSVDDMIDVFERFTKSVNEAIPAFGPHMFMAPYDWLVDSPAESIQALCQFAGMEFVPTMVASQTTASQVEGKHGRAHAIQRRASDAHKVMSTEEIEKIQRACEPWLDQWSRPGVLG